MIPATIHNMPAMTCVSAMQKAIRRGMEKESMEFAVELLHTPRAFHLSTTPVVNDCWERFSRSNFLFVFKILKWSERED